ncbi:MAG TPA: hypothetical protein VMF03_01840 [Steroidobacteraceae bacterium]|nr:hypothetical protein [Steroidobacteraceae bacterium]
MNVRNVVLMVLMGWAGGACAQDFPLWERILSHYSAKTDQTPVPSMKMGRHMQMSLPGQAAPGDAARAAQILSAAAAVVSRYRDVRTAERDGYKPFFPTGRMGEEIHYTNYRYRRSEQRRVDYLRPGSILYKRTPQGLEAVGVMYSAPVDAPPQQLDAIAPLSVATWHRHVDFCGWPKDLPAAERFGPGARFGPQGSIHSEKACHEARGLWIPVVLGWMTHVYPNGTPKWGGMEMDVESGSPE